MSPWHGQAKGIRGLKKLGMLTNEGNLAAKFWPLGWCALKTGPCINGFKPQKKYKHPSASPFTPVLLAFFAAFL